jgi:hypothetical protein
MPILGVVASSLSGNLGGLVGSYDALASVTLSAAADRVVFAGIPSGYKHLQIRGVLMTSGATNPTWQVNGDTTSSAYAGHHLWGNGVSATANAQTGTVYWNYNPSGSYPSAFIMDWLDYSSTTKNKVMRTTAGSDTNGSTSEMALWSGVYGSLNPITSITLNANAVNFLQNSTFSIYGVR